MRTIVMALNNVHLFNAISFTVYVNFVDISDEGSHSFIALLLILEGRKHV